MPGVDTESMSGDIPPVNFVLGVGAQKAGSTWLHHFLSFHPEVHIGPIKEYHVWDTFFLGGAELRRANLERRLASLGEGPVRNTRSALPVSVEKARANLFMVQFLRDHPGEYAQHFVDLARSRPGIKAVADITPSYALLDAPAYSHIQGVLESTGFVVRPVFILRDPVSRVISAYDMYRRRWNPKSDPNARNNPAPLEEFATWASVRRRTDYQHTVEGLEKSFNADGIFFGLFETFFTRETIGRLLEFLDISWTEPPVEHPRNKSRTGFRATKQQRQMLRESYADAYNFCFQHFPDWDLEQLWRDPSSVDD